MSARYPGNAAAANGFGRRSLHEWEAYLLHETNYPAPPDVRAPSRWRLGVGGVPVPPLPVLETPAYFHAEIERARASLAVAERALPDYATGNHAVWAAYFKRRQEERLTSTNNAPTPRVRNNSEGRRLWWGVPGRTLSGVLAHSPPPRCPRRRPSAGATSPEALASSRSPPPHRDALDATASPRSGAAPPRTPPPHSAVAVPAIDHRRPELWCLPELTLAPLQGLVSTLPSPAFPLLSLGLRAPRRHCLLAAHGLPNERVVVPCLARPAPDHRAPQLRLASLASLCRPPESCPCRRHTQIPIGISPEPTTHTPDPLLSIQSISGNPERQAPPGWIGSSAAFCSSPVASTTRTPLPEHQQDRRVPPLFPARPSLSPASPSCFLSLTGTPWSALALELQRDPCPWIPCFDHLLEPDHARPQAPATGTHAGSRSSRISGESATTRDIHGRPLVLRIAPDHHPQCRRVPVASSSPVRDLVCLPCLTPRRREFSPSPTSIGHSPATPSPHGPRPHHPKPDLAESSSIASLTFGLAGSAAPTWTLPLPGPAACRPLLDRVRCYRCFPVERASTNPSAKSTAIPCVLTTPLHRPLCLGHEGAMAQQHLLITRTGPAASPLSAQWPDVSIARSLRYFVHVRLIAMLRLLPYWASP
ncbi:extensin-like [Triticum dicoccoides]|uniref:extensin-like n=1 Tax=Triticum dicoccoides TaxID=85692 RepID=UPI00188EDCDE|nr:extensin-like [Triticum dicoccoides]